MGAIIAIFTAVLSSAKDITSKSLAANLHGTISAFASFLYAIPFYLVAIFVAWLLGIETFTISQGFFSYVLLRSLSDMFAETFKMHAFSHGELSSVASIISLHPIFILLFSPILTNDPLHASILWGVLLTVVGNLILLYKPGVALSKKAFWYALGTAFFFSLNNCFDRLSVQSASPLVSGFSMTFLAGVFLLIPALKAPQPLSSMKSENKVLFLRGFFEIVFMVSKLCALMFLQGPEVSAIMRISLILSVIGGKVIFKELHFWRKMLGAGVTVAGVVVVIVGA